MPVLTGVREPDVAPVLHDVGQEADFGDIGIVTGVAADRALDVAESLGEHLQRARVEVLIRESQYAVAPERHEHLRELAVTQRPRQIEALDRRSQHRAGRRHGHHRILLRGLTSPHYSRVSAAPSRSSARSIWMRTANPFFCGSRSFSGWTRRVQTSSYTGPDV